MDFASDNHSGVSAAILAAIAEEAGRSGGGYGDDEATQRATERLAEVFEHEVWVYPVITGTAANSLAISTLSPPWGGVVCHRDAHVLVDECGGPEFYGGGLRLVPIRGARGRIDPDDLAELALQRGAHDVHTTPLVAVTFTQATEAGTVYSVAETEALCTVARRAGLSVHLDGARFANAVVSTGASPAELTWRAGVDIVSFGATKNGAMGAEAIVCFDASRADELERRRKRGGHLLSKQRLVSAQLAAYLTDDLWLDNARASNAAAGRLATALAQTPGVELVDRVEANEVFVRVPTHEAERWRGAGVQFYDEVIGDVSIVRLVTSFSTTDDAVDRLIDVIAAGSAVDGAESTI